MFSRLFIFFSNLPGKFNIYFNIQNNKDYKGLFEAPEEKKRNNPTWMFSSKDFCLGIPGIPFTKDLSPFDSSSNIQKHPHLNRCLATFQRCGGGKPQVGISFHSNLDKLGHPNDRTTKTRFWWMVCEKLTILYVVFGVGNKSSSNFGVFLSTFI